jgi:hypothetical protein
LGAAAGKKGACDAEVVEEVVLVGLRIDDGELSSREKGEGGGRWSMAVHVYVYVDAWAGVDGDRRGDNRQRQGRHMQKGKLLLLINHGIFSPKEARLIVHNSIIPSRGLVAEAAI